jgi:hypothetical protein
MDRIQSTEIDAFIAYQSGEWLLPARSVPQSCRSIQERKNRWRGRMLFELPGETSWTAWLAQDILPWLIAGIDYHSLLFTYEKGALLCRKPVFACR